MTSAATYLDHYLEPFYELLVEPDVTDIYVNRPGEVWVERLDGQTETLEFPALDETMLARLARQIAALTHQAINREHPLLAGRLPDGTRVQIVAQPAARDSTLFAFRRHIVASLSLGDYEASGAFANVRTGDARLDVDRELDALYRQARWPEFLRAAVRARKTILVSGGTSSGKTTFLNSLIREIDPAERLIMIEDTPEIQIPHDNAVGMIAVRGRMGETQVGADDLLTASLRMRPDRIILGELRGVEALTFLRAINTGHPGSLSTIHADTTAGAFEQLGLLASSTGLISRAEAAGYAREVIDVVVQLERRAGRRTIGAIWWRPGGGAAE